MTRDELVDDLATAIGQHLLGFVAAIHAVTRGDVDVYNDTALTMARDALERLEALGMLYPAVDPSFTTHIDGAVTSDWPPGVDVALVSRSMLDRWCEDATRLNRFHARLAATLAEAREDGIPLL